MSSASRIEFVDLITQRDDAGRPHSYARNADGLHVPIETLDSLHLADAMRNRTRFPRLHELLRMPLCETG